MRWREFLTRPWLRLPMTEVPFRSSRRAFIKGSAAVVVAASIMPVRALLDDALAVIPGEEMQAGVEPEWDFGCISDGAVIRRAFIPRLYVQTYKQSPLIARLLAKPVVPCQDLAPVLIPTFAELTGRQSVCRACRFGVCSAHSPWPAIDRRPRDWWDTDGAAA